MAKPLTRKVPTACIRQTAAHSHCGRELGDKEYAFSDAGHAVRNYANSTTLRACPDCVTACAPMVKDHYIAPLATRGLENVR